MTYCVALRLREGIVCLSDTRTNAGVDDVALFRKMFVWHAPDDRAICLMTAGNLAVTQAVISRLQEEIDNPVRGVPNLMTAKTMFGVADVVGEAMRQVQQRYGQGLAAMGESSLSSILVAGQRAGGSPRLYHVYSAGNFIEATDETTFFQIGETKYGKPILDRIVGPDTPLQDGKTAVLLSMASTIRSNLSVGMPLDIAVIRTNTYAFEEYRRIPADDENFFRLSNAFSDALRDLFHRMREFEV